MQELTIPPQAASPYTPVGGANTTPGLGTPVPGTTGGLPPLSGLSVSQNPLAPQLRSQEQGGPAQMQMPGMQSDPQQAAQQTQSMGRGEDTMLVHMTPGEVNSLRGLAQRFGGDLTVNPNTGLPEASFLKKVLPTILGVAGAAFGIPTWAIGLGVGAGKTALTGDLNKGLMAGLQAFGGAGLGQAAGIGGKLGSVGADLGLTKSVTGASEALTNLAGNTGGAAPIGKAAEGTLEAAFDKTFGAKAPGFLSKFGAETSLGQTGILGNALPALAGTSVLSGISDATAPKMPTYKAEENKFNYVPMRAARREVRFQTPEQMRASGGAEIAMFTPSNPDPVRAFDDYGFAAGGAVDAPMPSFNDIVGTYRAQDPGAITASMFPTPVSMPTPTAPSAPAAGVLPPRAGETIHSFNRPTANPLPSGGGFGDLLFAPNQLRLPLLARMAVEQGVQPRVTGGGLGGVFAAARLNREMSRARRGMNRSAPSGSPVDALGIAPQPNLMQSFARGGVHMEDGSFVVDARTVSEIGNGSSNAGIEALSRMGGRPVRGPGDGVSDSVKASIGGTQEARVARDEVIFSPEAVRRIGGGSDKRGTQKLYALMDKAHKARKKAKRGQDTGVRKGLA